ncbi:aggregation-promoting factor C-terminal-like domain-containing protein [Bifidobacterium eulemuris]|uniref:G5 domain-containing protein n=1 Tax=Bifidobacterium eulemuris TaxID=1765219 RepID=A0A261GAW1_9BIFI|nr:phage tail tip lysozyme [Bifidobacterium eulemuris]OZG68572.1 G5 domain-containing protein [Bifidobacterium eulemuris]QOL32701.1 G5 domain-containing protein [Bifidobacterium eulemuris]
MASHRKNVPTLKSLSKRQWMKIAASFAAVGMLATAGVVTNTFYRNELAASQSVTEFSATDTSGVTVSRGTSRDSLKGADRNTTFVTVKINGETRIVLGEKDSFTDVKSVLDAGNITLESGDTVSPALTDEVDESTVITIERAGAELETSQTAIAFNTVYKETDDLAEGEEEVESEGEEGVMETTSLVTRAGDTVVSSNVFASYVKKAPVDRVILVGTGSTASSSGSSSDANLGTTVPASEMQQWAHDYLISNGYSESDFSAAVYIINHESGWNPTATNASSGAYGLAQALPGSKMASAGADWQTNYQTQFKWFVSYCNGRYGSLAGAYEFWVANHWY